MRGRVSCIAVFAIVICQSSTPAFAAQFSAAPVQLSMSGVNISYFGWATALSANSQEALVGGGGCESTAAPSGAFIYTRAGGTWDNPVQLSETGVPASNSFGCAVALSANGQVALVGSSLSNTAYVFTETNGSWSAPVKLSLSGITPSEFGYAVALSSDGKTALIGDIGANSAAGAVYVYTYNGTTWSTGTSLTPSGLSSAQYGYSIAMSSNGSTGLVALIGATQIGKAYVSTYNGSSWSTPAAISTAGITNASGSFGTSVALSANGQSAAVGSPFENSGVGAAYVYTGTGTAGSFGNPTALSFPANTTVRGYSVAMAPGGQEVFAGAPLGSTSSTNMGIVNAYTYNGSSWSAPVTLSTQGFQSQGGAGWSLAEAANGQELLVGAPFANANAGLGYIYESPAAVTASVTPNPGQVAPGKNVELDITVTNADTVGGGLPAVNLSDLVLTDTLPAGSTFVSSNAANGSCSHASTTVTCTLAALNAGTNSQNPWQPSITITTPSAAGKISNNVTFLANEPLTGTSSLTTSITNDVTPTVTSGNITTTAGTAVSGMLQATPGFSGQLLTFAIVTQPSHGTVTLTNANTGAFTYTPDSGYTGNDTLIFTAGDGTVTSAPGSETIAVGTSGSGGSSSSGKSGGGSLGWLTLMIFTFLLVMRNNAQRT
ncbi:MAG: Ig-like domain-containing protein [Gammaproteobacteria bacterium]